MAIKISIGQIIDPELLQDETIPAQWTISVDTDDTIQWDGTTWSPLSVASTTSTSTTIDLQGTTIHGSRWAPLIWNITADTTNSTEWAVDIIYHNDTVAPSFTWVDAINWNYAINVINRIEVVFEAWSVIAFISQTN